MRLSRVVFAFAAAMVLLVSPAFADDGAAEKKLYEDVKPSLVAVKYTFESELGKQELIGAGIIIGDDGLVVMSIEIVTPQIVPDGQMKDFKIIVPSDTEDETEIDATLQGRDERSSLAFVKATSPQKWKSIKFVDAPVAVGDQLYSVGMLPKASGYKTYITAAKVAAKLRGPVPQVLVDGALAGACGVVLTADGQAMGYVHPRSLAEVLLDGNRDDLGTVNSPPHVYVPASDFLRGLDDQPTPEKPVIIPWMGCELKGLDKEVAEYFGLKNKPSVQVGDVVADSPAEKAGLKAADIIVSMDGKPLERGDLPVEIPAILTRKVSWLKPGATVTFGVIHEKTDTPKDITVTLAARPTEAFEAHRYYAKDLGFVSRDVTFDDTYRRKLPRTTGGVTIALLRPQAAAQAAKLHIGDLVTQMNGKPVTDLEQFKKDYQQFRKDKPHDAVVLVVSQQDGKEQTINIEPPQSGVVPGGDMEP